MSSSPRRLPAALALVLLAGTAHGRALGNHFVGDDTGVILANRRLDRPVDWGGLVWRNYWGELTDRGSLWRPLTLLSFGADATLFGKNPFFFHGTNLLLHVLATLLLLRLVRPYLGPGGAWFAAALFAVHPVHTEAVAGVVGRAELLAALGSLVALLAHRRGGAVTLLAGLAYAFALGAKESAAALPLLCLILDLLARRVRLWPYALYAAVLAAYLLLRRAVLGPYLFGAPLPPYTVENPLWHVPDAVRRLTALKLLALYFRRCLWPWPLSSDYSDRALPPATGPGDPAVVAGAALLVVWGGVAVWSWRRGRAAPLLGLALFVVPLLAVLNFFFPVGTIFAERFLYLPVAGAALLPASLPRRRPRWLAAAGCGLLVLFWGRAWGRTGDWATDLTLARSAVAAVPTSAKAHHDYGNALVRGGRLREALREYRAALRLRPDFLSAHVRLALVLARIGLTARAEAHYRAALRVAPDHGTPLLRLAKLLLRTARPGTPRFAEGLRLGRRAVARLDALRGAGALGREGAAAARQVLAQGLVRAGRAAAALPLLHAAVALLPGSAPLREDLVLAYLAAGAPARALVVLDGSGEVLPGRTRRRLAARILAPVSR